MENIHSLEREFADNPDQRLSVGWSHLNQLEPTAKLLGEIINGNTNALPLPETNSGYENFRFLVHSKDKSTGISDGRIYNHGDLLFFQANIGGLQGTEELWERVMGRIDFPVEVADVERNTVSNPARMRRLSTMAPEYGQSQAIHTVEGANLSLEEESRQEIVESLKQYDLNTPMFDAFCDFARRTYAANESKYNRTPLHEIKLALIDETREQHRQKYGRDYDEAYDAYESKTINLAGGINRRVLSERNPTRRELTKHESDEIQRVQVIEFGRILMDIRNKELGKRPFPPQS
jgi:hypothetical protein